LSELISSAVEIIPKKMVWISLQNLFLSSSRMGSPSLEGIPPSPTPVKSRAWRGFHKNGLQNPERLGVRGQNIDFKELAGVLASGSLTAFALTMICFLRFQRKGRCHSRLWISWLS